MKTNSGSEVESDLPEILLQRMHIPFYTIGSFNNAVVTSRKACPNKACSAGSKGGAWDNGNFFFLQ
jgi:hypothetical protein